jgi:hypothetical protein
VKEEVFGTVVFRHTTGERERDAYRKLTGKRKRPNRRNNKEEIHRVERHFV